ncbi:glycine cleavage system T protein [Dacryopinax primogenitus]|uniref:Aminomethyltransferase n=1 Tax=Dacryopinax primogenitus (strain DJM 731) TaxID=1858805 RepID=M5G8I7_DACPD|nr:glycine cleavage system T protein [Dacryopinax primogenitus]EJU05064.1 glycine cleavage system T protein [Dacryopinax primogenitus]
MFRQTVSRASGAARKGMGMMSRRGMASDAPKEELMETGLYDFHVKHGAKMVPFAGFSMPLSYGSVGQIAAHNHVRNSVGLFDVGHMVQSFIRGPSAPAFLEWITPSGFASLPHFSSQLSVILNDRGGIIDDNVICRHDDTTYYVVTNAGRRVEDLAWLKEKIEQWNESRADKVEMEVLENQGLVALQGPEAPSVLQKLTPYDLTQLHFGKSTYADIAGVRCHVARGGYTGEDGFEISIPKEHTVSITETLLQGPVQMTGLGARDSLRLEAGMCLYGHDLNEDISPIEAALAWVIPKSRREKGEFIGSGTVLEQLKDGPIKRRVGLIIDDAPAREGAEIFSDTQEPIGVVTSGIPSPTLGKNIAMGYVKSGFHKKGTSVLVQVRNKTRKATITPMPFVPTKYYRSPGA